jgi:hypothetical protein
MEKQVATNNNKTIIEEGHDSTQFITTITATNLSFFSLIPNENKTTQVCGEASAHKVARKFSNNFRTKPHNKDEMFTITLSKKYGNFFNQFQLVSMKVTILG